MKNHPRCPGDTAWGLRQRLDARIERMATYAQEREQRFTAVAAERDALQAKVEQLQVTVRELQTELYGRRTERSELAPDPVPEPPEPEPTEGAETQVSVVPIAPRRPRGQQRGAPGHGRQRHAALPEEIVAHTLPEAARRCPRCGALYREFDDATPTEERDWQVRVVRRVHRRHRYAQTGHGDQVPALLTAPGPARPIPKGLFSAGFLAQRVIEKFLLGLPVHRQRIRLRLAGLTVSAGTITGALHRVQTLVEPWYHACVRANQAERQVHADETRWPVLGPEGYRGWLWVFLGQQTTVFQVATTRGGRIVRQHLLMPPEMDTLTAEPDDPTADAPAGITGPPRILISDFYRAYQPGERAGWVWAGCWVHARRPILRVAKALPDLAEWGAGWKRRIAA